MSTQLLLLLIWLQLKHFIADYLLQGEYMLGKFKEKGWQLPLTVHCLTHLVFTTTLALFFISPLKAFVAGLLDFVIHFGMDALKARPNLLGRFKTVSPLDFEVHKRQLESCKGDKFTTQLLKLEFKEKMFNNKLFWWSLGLDQTVHHITDITILYLLLKG